jgi:hypothetical protein
VRFHYGVSIFQVRRCSRFHRYSLSNVCLIATQRRTATQVAGFGTWKALHRSVVVANAALRSSRRSSASAKTGEGSAGVRSSASAPYVFDVAQTDGEPLPEIASAAGDPGESTTRLTAAITASGIQVDFADGLGGALGLSLGGRIAVQRSLPPATELLVLAHEWAHELLHRREERPASRDIRELEAQAVSFVVCEAVGLESLAATVDYIHLYRGDRQALAASLDRIQRTATAIIRVIGVAR